MLWLDMINEDLSLDAHAILGGLIADFMERKISDPPSWGDPSEHDEQLFKNREQIKDALARHGLTYLSGGHIHKSGASGPIHSLEQILRTKDLAAVDKEFNRALTSIEADPPASLTAACAIVEALCKIYIEENSLPLPKDQSIKPLWNVLRQDLGFEPSRVEDDDLKKILGGLNSLVDGLGSLRTHASSAHGRGKKIYNVQPRHARLAVHAAHTLAVFVIETWEHNEKIRPLNQ